MLSFNVKLKKNILDSIFIHLLQIVCCKSDLTLNWFFNESYDPSSFLNLK